LRLRLTDENRSESRQEKNGEGRGAGRFRRSRKRQRMVRRPVRRVMVAVVMVVAIIVVVVMQVSIRDRRHRVVEMRLSGEMCRDVVDVEGKQQRSEKTAPPTRRVRRAMAALRSASVRHQFRESSFPAGSPSTIEFRPAQATHRKVWSKIRTRWPNQARGAKQMMAAPSRHTAAPRKSQRSGEWPSTHLSHASDAAM
jgi:type VI protein secretion system component VasK